MIIKQFGVVALNGNTDTVYNARNEFDCDTALATCLRRWAHYDGRHAVL